MAIRQPLNFLKESRGSSLIKKNIWISRLIPRLYSDWQVSRLNLLLATPLRNDPLEKRFIKSRYFLPCPGHEICGTVFSLGKSATSDSAKLGDQVVVYPWIYCNSCRACRTGYNNSCDCEDVPPVYLGLTQDGGYNKFRNVLSCYLEISYT